MPDIKPHAAPAQLSQLEKSGKDQEPVSGKKGGFFKVLLIIIIIAMVIIVGLYLVSKYTSWNVLSVNKTNGVATSGWQAVFLSNGQVYFGRIGKETENKLVLRDIYYLQVTKQIQPADQNATEQQQNVSLVKLGNELHGPKDEMVINKDQVLFTEELKEDSKVVDAIMRYVNEQ